MYLHDKNLVWFESIVVINTNATKLSKNIVSYVEQNDWFQDDLVFFLPIFENQGD
jgi:hypothetical protein